MTGCAIIVAGTFAAAAARGTPGMNLLVVPLVPPQLPLLPLIGLVAALLPAWITPLPPDRAPATTDVSTRTPTGGAGVIRFESVTIRYPDAQAPVLGRRRPARPRGRALPGRRTDRLGQVDIAAAPSTGSSRTSPAARSAGRVLVDGRDTRTHAAPRPRRRRRYRRAGPGVGLRGGGRGGRARLRDGVAGPARRSCDAGSRRRSTSSGSRICADRPLATLSGGQQQRVAIGAALDRAPPRPRTRRAHVSAGPAGRRGGAGRIAAARPRPGHDGAAGRASAGACGAVRRPCRPPRRRRHPARRW